MDASESEPPSTRTPITPIDAAATHLKHASEQLALAKSRYDEAQATYDSAKIIYEALEASSQLTALSSKTKLCDSCARIPLSNIFGRPWPILKQQRRRVGDLFQAVERQSWCVLCKFLIEAFQIGAEHQDEKLGAHLKARDSAIYFADDPNGLPWFQRAGVDIDVPSCPFVWLQTGMPTITGLPHICITFEPTGVDQAKPSILASPRQRDPLEAFNGAMNYALLRSWIEKCTTHHGDRCNRKTKITNAELEIVLIDVSNRQLVRRSTSDRFVALSYVWGKGTEVRLRSFDTENGQSSEVSKSSNRKPIDRSRLPKRVPQTVEDAIAFVQWLGEQYLWVDLYCIDQNNKSEMQTQIKAMDRIFSSSFCTLINLDGENADWGLPGVSRPLLQTQQPSVNLNTGRLVATFMYSVWHNNGTSVWDSRAWTLQERLLSPRCIIFAKNYVAMACQEEYFHDCLDFDSSLESRLGNDYFREDGSDIKLDGTEWDFKVYDALVSVYSGRKLTMEADALNACLGSFNRISRSTGYIFKYGLPVEDILRAMLWKPHHDHTVERRTDFPSWSWLGWSGRVECCYWIDDMADYVDAPSDAEDSSIGPPAKRRRLQWFGEEVWHPEKAEVVRLPPEDGISHELVLSTTVAKFRLRKLRISGAPHKNLRPDSQQSKTAVGDHWTMLGADSNPLRNSTGEHPIFEPTDVFFRVSPHISKLLEDQQSIGEFAFIHEWRKIRDSAQSNKWCFDMISVLLIIRNKDEKTAMRVASVVVEKEHWMAQKPIAEEIVLRLGSIGPTPTTPSTRRAITDTDITNLTSLLSSTTAKLSTSSTSPDSYAESLKRWSRAAEKPAGLAVIPSNASEVSIIVKYANENDIDLAVKGGGHSTAGVSSTDGGLLIDLHSAMRGVEVDMERKLLKVQGGANWGDVDHAAWKHGLATVGGTVVDTGVGGLALGGGYGWLSGQYGLVIDNMVEVEVVLADGSIRRISEKEDPELWWGVLGAGQNFGVVTEFVFKAYDQGEVWAGLLIYPPTEEHLKKVVDATNRLYTPDENGKTAGAGKAAGGIAFARPPPAEGKVVILVTAIYFGTEDEGKEVFKEFLDLGPVMSTMAMVPYPVCNTVLAPPYGLRASMKGAAYTLPLRSEFLHEILGDYTQLTEKNEDAATSLMLWEVYDPYQVASRDLGCFANRGWHLNGMICPIWTNPDNDQECRQWARYINEKFKKELERQGEETGPSKHVTTIRGPKKATQFYGNYDHYDERSRDIFGENYGDLQKLKAKYDPLNVFNKLFAITPSN